MPTGGCDRCGGTGTISPVRGVICEDGRDSGRLHAFGSERMVPKKRPIVAPAAATARREAMRRAGPRPVESARAWTDLSTGRRKMSDCAAVARHSDRKAGRVACIYNCSADSPDTRLGSADPDATAAAGQGRRTCFLGRRALHPGRTNRISSGPMRLLTGFATDSWREGENCASEDDAAFGRHAVGAVARS